MVHALDALHTVLRPRGVLLDIRPAPDDAWVEGARQRSPSAIPPALPPSPAPLDERQDEHVVRLGQVHDPYRTETQVTAEAAMRAHVAAGSWVRERDETFTFIYHFDSVDAWLAHMDAHMSSAHMSAGLVARARRYMARQPATTDPPREARELRLLRRMRASRLRRA